jgi:hypothetical protein
MTQNRYTFCFVIIYWQFGSITREHAMMARYYRFEAVKQAPAKIFAILRRTLSQRKYRVTTTQ